MDAYDFLAHYGTPRHSGRYPWGSGDNPYQRTADFLSRVEELRKELPDDTAVAKALDMSTSEFRQVNSIARAEKRAADRALAIRLKDSGMSNTAIGKQMGINESSVRSLLNDTLNERSKITSNVADTLKKTVGDKKYIDVGLGCESSLGVSQTKLNTALKKLKEEGYTVTNVQIDQLGTAPGSKTTIKVLAPPGTTYKDIVSNYDKIQLPYEYHSNDGGRTFLNLEPPQSISSKRIQVRYNEDGGTEKDGVIELRRGVEDISLGNSKYAQVRIAVDGTHYLKGMAVYSDDMPDGVDVIFNTNKHRGTPLINKEDKNNQVLKSMKSDPDNPFGATIKAGGQSHYIGKDGKDHLSAINKVNEEGDWDKWGKTLSSQMLSKQDPKLAKRQLDLTYARKKNEYDEIMALTNPVVKQRLLNSFADDCDASSVHLKAAGLPRQRFQVILPVNSIKQNQIYAPNFKDGESVVLIRYPHGGTFEIPELTVNNRQPAAKKMMGGAKDAVGIHPKVAERLSGADFDGDTVLVIPTSTAKIKTSAPLEGLKDFDPKEAYPYYEGMRVIKPRTKQQEMGNVSNLITDMTIKGATEDEICKAVKHSMVVIDSEKHRLNYKQSAIDNSIAELKKKYQGGERSGAATLISKASSEYRTEKRTQGADIVDPVTGKPKRLYVDPVTGKKLYRSTPEEYTVSTVKDPITKENRRVYVDSKTGKAVFSDTREEVPNTYKITTKTVSRTTKSTKMAEVDDAMELSSGTRIENVYAKYANQMKDMGNNSRRQALNVEPFVYSPSAKQTYAREVASLNAKLDIAIRNKPLERQAQVIANSVVNAKLQANPSLDKDDLKKLKSQALAEARTRTGADKAKTSVKITDREWEAIQAGAISATKLKTILENTDLDRVKELATPRANKGLTSAKLTKAKALLNKGYTQAEVADVIGVSVSTLNREL